MNKRTARIILLSAALAATAVGVTGATEQKSKGKGVPAKTVPFSVTGVYSGSFDGEITVNGQSVFVNDKTTFHRVGKGPVSADESVTNTAVYIGGVMKGKKAIATMVLIGERETSNDFSQTTVEGAESDSKTAKEGR